MKTNKFDAYRKKTFTSYWNHFSTNPKKFQSTSIFFTKFKKFLKKLIGIKIQIYRYKKLNAKNESLTSYQKNISIINYRNELLANVVKNYLRYFNLTCDHPKIICFIEEYSKKFSDTPIQDMNSGFGFNEGLFLYCLIKVLRPTLVIESGVMRGFTTYIIDAASEKNCLIYCYDISFENLKYKSKKASYFNNDITKTPPNLKGHKVLAFWDDHTSQLDRLEFSIKNKIKFNIFDDDLSFLNFHSDGWPPIPSISMLYQIKAKIINENVINWMSRDREGVMNLDEIIKNKSIDKIKFYKLFPHLFTITGYKSHSECSFLILR